MKKLWVRLGAYLELTDEEEKRLLSDDIDIAECEKIVRNIIAELRFLVDGECYAPQSSIADFNDEYGTNYEELDYEFSQ